MACRMRLGSVLKYRSTALFLQNHPPASAMTRLAHPDAHSHWANDLRADPDPNAVVSVAFGWARVYAARKAA